MNAKYSSIVGITQDELEYNFKDYLSEASKQLNLTKKQLLDKLKLWYNGYNFDKNLNNSVYNLWSLLQFFETYEFQNYWFSTGTPTFLINKIKKHNFDLTKLNNLNVSSRVFEVSEIEQVSIVSLLYQTGYLTIKGYEDEDSLYNLDFPNYEVRSSFLDSLLPQYTYL